MIICCCWKASREIIGTRSGCVLNLIQGNRWQESLLLWKRPWNAGTVHCCYMGLLTNDTTREKYNKSLIRLSSSLTACMHQSITGSHLKLESVSLMTWSERRSFRTRGLRASGSNRFGLWCAATLLAVIHCLRPPYAPLVVSTGGTWQLLMYSAGTSGHISSAWLPPQTLHTSLIYGLAPQTPGATYTVAGSTDTEEIQLCSLNASKQLWGICCTREGLQEK